VHRVFNLLLEQRIFLGDSPAPAAGNNRRTFILCGGPDITMKDEAETLNFFEKNSFVDLLVFGEAETKIASLVRAGLSDKRLR